jgi:hypothetical protein
MKYVFFFNAVFNYKSETGASKYVWGIKEFDLNLSIKDQVFTYSDDAECERIKSEDAFNFNLILWSMLNLLLILNINQGILFKVC